MKTAQDLIASQLSGRPFSEVQQVIAALPPHHVSLIQDFLDSENEIVRDNAAYVTRRVLREYARHITPHDLSPELHAKISNPVLQIGIVLHEKFGVHPLIGKYGSAFTVLFAGAFMATNPVHEIPRFIWDGLAYTIHGLGAAPIAEAILKRLREKI